MISSHASFILQLDRAERSKSPLPSRCSPLFCRSAVLVLLLHRIRESVWICWLRAVVGRLFRACIPVLVVLQRQVVVAAETPRQHRRGLVNVRVVKGEGRPRTPQGPGGDTAPSRRSRLGRDAIGALPCILDHTMSAELPAACTMGCRIGDVLRGSRRCARSQTGVAGGAGRAVCLRRAGSRTARRNHCQRRTSRLTAACESVPVPGVSCSPCEGWRWPSSVGGGV